MKARGAALGAGYFRATPEECARGLIGCVFEWNACAGVIVETEAYAAEGDEACHTAFRPSAREFVASHERGTAYVYLNYGMHWLFNVLVKGPGGNGFVLFRALNPLAGIPAMRARRPKSRREQDLCSGPGKLTQALGIEGTAHGVSFLGKPDTGIWRGGDPGAVVAAPRIGISRAKELPWRFAALESPCLSAPAGLRAGPR